MLRVFQNPTLMARPVRPHSTAVNKFSLLGGEAPALPKIEQHEQLLKRCCSRIDCAFDILGKEVYIELLGFLFSHFVNASTAASLLRMRSH